MATNKKSFRAFTLIELLIVVAIIAILAAIAVPNFLEAQMRAKVARVKSDMRTISIAINSYVVDCNMPPHLAAYVKTDGTFTGQITRDGIDLCTNLSTPIAYMSTVEIKDPFTVRDHFPDTTSNCIHYVNILMMAKKGSISPPNTVVEAPRVDGQNHPNRFALISLGPDYVKGPSPATVAGVDCDPFYIRLYGNTALGNNTGHYAYFTYDPSNGTVSGGDILRHE